MKIVSRNLNLKHFSDVYLQQKSERKDFCYLFAIIRFLACIVPILLSTTGHYVLSESAAYYLFGSMVQSPRIKGCAV